MMPYDPYAQMYPSPYLPAGALAPKPPPLSPEEEKGVLGRLMEKSLGGLSYLGKIVDKTFGARAVRGLLGGRPEELLSAIPLSDTLGLTREENTVHGTDLLANAGLITRGDTSLENEIAGVGAEIALDPTLFVGAAVPRLVARGLKGTGSTVGAGLEAVSGVNPYTYAARQADRAYQGVRAPLRALFDPTVAGAWRPDVQPLGEAYSADLKAGEAAARARHAEAQVEALKTVEGLPVAPNDVYKGLLPLAEGFGKGMGDLAAAGLPAANAARLRDVVQNYAGQVRDTNPRAAALGASAKDFEDIPTWVMEANQAHQAATAGVPPLIRRPEPFPGDLPFPGYQRADYFPASMVEWGDAAGAGRRRSARLSGTSPFQITREEDFRGIPGGRDTLNEWAADPHLSGQAASLTPDAAAELLAQRLTDLPTVPLDHPARGQAKRLAERLRELPPEATTKGWFSTDVFGGGLARDLEGARQVASAKTILAGVTQFSEPVAALEARGQRYVRVPDFLGNMGLTHVDTTGTPVAQELALHALAPTHGLSTGGGMGDLRQLRGLAIPEDVAADMARIGQSWKTPEVLAPVVDFWDKTVSVFKTYLTKLFPAFHARNLMSGAFNMWRDGALSASAGQDMFRVIRGGSLAPETAAKLYPGMALPDATKEFLKEVMANDVAFTRNTRTAERAGVQPAQAGGQLLGDLPQVGGAVRPLSEDVGGWLGGFVPEKGKVGSGLNPFNVGVDGDPATYVGQADKLGNTIEDWIRGTHYLAKRVEGAAPTAARESVMKYQIDYQDLTPFEKNVMKRAFPWYSFSRKTLPPLLHDLAEKPWKVATTMRALTGTRTPGEFVPPWVAEGASIPIPGAPEGEQRYVASFGLPMEDELVKALGSAAHGDYQRVLQQGFGMSQPFVKLPAELATDTQMFSGRKLEDLKPYEFASLGGLLPDDAARQVTQVVANTPAGRFGSTLNKLVDERKGTLPTALNFGTGAQITDVDTAKVKDITARNLLQETLRGQPGVRMREEVTVPDATRQALSPDDLLRYDLLREIEARQAKRAREAKKGKALTGY